MTFNPFDSQTLLIILPEIILLLLAGLLMTLDVIWPESRKRSLGLLCVPTQTKPAPPAKPAELMGFTTRGPPVSNRSPCVSSALRETIVQPRCHCVCSRRAQVQGREGRCQRPPAARVSYPQACHAPHSGGGLGYSKRASSP